MTHATGNGTWQDYPSLATLISAPKLENIENAADRLHVSEYGSKTRTKRSVTRVYYNSSYVHTAGSDLWVGSGWVNDYDSDAGWTSASPSYYTFPIGGRRWDVSYKMSTGTLPLNANFAVKLVYNTQNLFNNSIASDNVRGTGGEAHVNAFLTSAKFNAGDKLYFGVYSSVQITVGWIFGYVYPEITVRDVGPA
jgi:hypothetical protein